MTFWTGVLKGEDAVVFGWGDMFSNSDWVQIKRWASLNSNYYVIFFSASNEILEFIFQFLYLGNFSVVITFLILGILLYMDMTVPCEVTGNRIFTGIILMLVIKLSRGTLALLNTFLGLENDEGRNMFDWGWCLLL